MKLHWTPLAMALFATHAVAQSSPSKAQAMTAVSWDEAQQPGITHMVWVRGWYGGGQYQAEVAAKQLAELPPGQRVIFFWQDCFTPKLDKLNVAQQLATGIEFNSQPFYAFFERLKLRGVVPDRIVLDYEETLTNWAIGPQSEPEKLPAFFDTLGNDVGFQLVLPDALKGITGKQLMSDKAVIIAYNAYTAGLSLDALRRSVARPAWEMLQRPIPVTNFNDVRTSFAVPDINDWPIGEQHTASVGFESSPALYISVGNRLRQPSPNASGAKKHPGWNALIDSLNIARSCANRGPIAPWVSRPDIGPSEFPLWLNRRLNQELLRHLRAMNTTTLLYFNPKPDLRADPTALSLEEVAQSEAMMQQWLTDLSAMAVSDGKERWTPIPLDADEISTGGVRWTYKEFVSELYAPRETKDRPRRRK